MHLSLSTKWKLEVDFQISDNPFVIGHLVRFEYLDRLQIPNTSGEMSVILKIRIEWNAESL